MAENENNKKPHHPRRNPPQRPLPGVQKAINNFGVSDLRQLLDQKHKEQGDSHSEKPIDPKKIPPPDPSYNYLRDPARDSPRAPQPHDNRKSRPQEEIVPENPKTSNFRGRQPRRGNPQNQTTNEPSSANFRGRNPRRGRGNGRPKTKDNLETIVDLLNIKIEVSSETGQRSCILDEETKIADIKHVPDHQSPVRGSPRRGRGSFRGRGRGYYRGRGRGGKLPENNPEELVEEAENEFSSEYKNNPEEVVEEFSSEYNDDSVEQAQFDSNLTETITVTSSKLPNSDVERLVEVKLENDENSEEKNNTDE